MPISTGFLKSQGFHPDTIRVIYQPANTELLHLLSGIENDDFHSLFLVILENASSSFLSREKNRLIATFRKVTGYPEREARHMLSGTRLFPVDAGVSKASKSAPTALPHAKASKPVPTALPHAKASKPVPTALPHAKASEARKAAGVPINAGVSKASKPVPAALPHVEVSEVPKEAVERPIAVSARASGARGGRPKKDEGEKLVPVSLLLDPALKADLEGLARDEERTFTAYVRLILKRHVASNVWPVS